VEILPTLALKVWWETS